MAAVGEFRACVGWDVMDDSRPDKTRQDKTRQDKTTQHNTTQHNTTQHNTTQHNKKRPSSLARELSWNDSCLSALPVYQMVVVAVPKLLAVIIIIIIIVSIAIPMVLYAHRYS